MSSLARPLPSLPAIPDVLPDAPRIADICAMADPAQRNLWITYTYHRLEVALAARLGGDDVSWCAYGTWASKSAGRFIRGEVVLDVLRPLFARSAALGRIVARIDADVRARIGRGNLMVFAELAPLFRALLDVLDLPASRRAEAAERAFAGLLPGTTAEGGQELLQRAFAAYVAAAATTDVKARAEQILLANTLIGYHEQIRLQPTIAAALSAPLAVLVEAEAAPLRGALAGRLGGLARTLLTRWMMRIELPEGALALGRDVPATRDGRMFPAALVQIEHPELRAVLDAIDRTPDTTAGSAADDWAELADRMNFIVDLFRSRQRDASLRRPPFSPEQITALCQGARPDGPL